ncbi:bone marrow stromal antigen 2 [Ictidomys tridecemlineatus]|nr:bone marrow stromal antigen 2 [Ictidomys tridecemlineatus]
MGMAPSFYHYLPVPLDDQMKEGGPRRCWLGLMVGLVMAGLIIALSIFMVRYYSEACQNGLELERQCHNVTQLLKKQLIQAKEESLAAETRADTCDQTVSRLQTQLKTLKTEVEEAKAQGTQMGVENGELTEALARWEAVATESAQRLDEVLRRASAAEAEGEACAAREAALRERVITLEAELGPPRRGSRPRPRSGSRSRASPRSRSRPGPTKGCRRPPRREG